MNIGWNEIPASLDRAWLDVARERGRQDSKWGDQTGNPCGVWLAILTEEIGEAAAEAIEIQCGRDLDERRTAALRAELVAHGVSDA